MTATEELRALLDERGVEHYDGTDMTLWLKDGTSIYRAAADEGLNGFVRLSLWCTTPAQAVEATFGRGECRMQIRDDIRGHDYQETYECSECGEQVVRDTYMGESEPPKYCPECGRKVVSE